MAASLPVLKNLAKVILQGRLSSAVLSSSSHRNTQIQSTWSRSLMMSRRCYQEEEEGEANEEVEETSVPKRKVVDVDTSVRYVNSKAFEKGYGDKPVWFHYRRNFKGRFPPPTRMNCLRKGEINTASPCPICRDEYLVLGEKNTKLLEQFICPHSGEIYDSMKTGLCQTQQKNLTVAVMKAYDEGLLEMKLPFRMYDYEDYKS